MIKAIVSVDKSKDGKKTYAMDLNGLPMFGRTEAITAQLKPGAYVNVVQQLQTKTYNDKGELVDLPVEQQVMNDIITAVFPNRQAAIAAQAEGQLFDKQVEAYVKSETKKIAAEFNLEDAEKAV